MTANRRPSRGRVGIAIGIALWAAVGVLGGWVALRLASVDAWYPMAQLVAFTPYLAAAAPVPVIVALATRRRWAAGVAALVALSLAGCVLPRWLPDRAPLADAHGPTVRVLTANLLVGGADAAALVALVREHRVDLLAVQELTPAAVAALDAAGLADHLPYRVAYPRDGVTGSGIYARHRLRDDGLRVNPCGFGQARATLVVPGLAGGGGQAGQAGQAGGAELLVESVHPCAPSSADTTPPWRRGLAGQPPATVDGPARVLLGDFNATLDHSLLRNLLATGYRDAADVRGAGLVGTWGPYDGDLIPPVTLDRVLADRRVGVRAVRVHALAGSDHRSVLAELVLP